MRLFAETSEPALVLMPFLGGSHREWAGVVELLAGQWRCVCVDLPGFGGSVAVPGYSVAEMAESVMETLAGLDLGRFALVGHSMAAKVAAVVARHAAEGDTRVRGLEGLVLVAPSPTGPEPMTERKRAQMLEALGAAPGADESAQRKNRDAAEGYLRDNSAEDVAPEVFESLVDDVVRMNRAAWRAWLESGSKEDWSERVGVLGLPVLLVAGDKDEALGPDAQREVSLPHWPAARLAVLHSNHLIPVEKPAELARLIAEFARGLSGEGVRADVPGIGAVAAVAEEVPLDRPYIDLILSDRVSKATREVLSKRAEADDPAYTPQALTITELAELRAVAARVVPQRGPVSIDVGARIDRELAEGKGDGWRYAELPPDAEACVAGLRSLGWHSEAEHGKGWLALGPAEQDALLERAQAGNLGRTLRERLEGLVGRGPEGEPSLDAEQMKRWFEDVRAMAARIYVAHPATLDRLGYSGIGDGAESVPGVGFELIGIGEVEAWEPVARFPPAGSVQRAAGVEVRGVGKEQMAADEGER